MPKAKRKAPVKKSGSKKAVKKRSKSSKKLFKYILVVFFAVCVTALLYNYRDCVSKVKSFPPVNLVIDRINAVRDLLFVEKWDATLYFGDKKSDFLVREHRRISSPKSPEKKVFALINELIDGPVARSVRTIPEQTMLRSVKISKSGLTEVDFSSELSDYHPGGSSAELMTIFSIVNTLIANIEEIKSVKILIEGSEVDTIAGHIDCRKPFKSNTEIVR